MTLSVGTKAAPWAYDLAKDIDQEIDNHIWPYVSKTAIEKATLPPAANHVWQKFFLTDGASSKPEAISNGTNWVYPDGTSV